MLQILDILLLICFGFSPKGNSKTLMITTVVIALFVLVITTVAIVKGTS